MPPKKKVSKPKKETGAIKTKSIFDFLQCLFVSKTSWEDLSDQDKKAFSPYMINRFISMHPDYVQLVNYFQQFNIGEMKPREVYRMYLDILPRGKFYAKYIKSSKDTDTKISSSLIEFIAKTENWSKHEAEDNLSYLIDFPAGIESIKQHLKNYGISDSEIAKTYKIK